MTGKSAYGKGDRTRPCDQKKFAEGWQRVFGKKSVKNVKKVPPKAD